MLSLLRGHQLVGRDHEILVTEAGFVTMAILADRAIEIEQAVIVPGVDQNGLRGFLVLTE